jgi:hypothetical protein
MVDADEGPSIGEIFCGATIGHWKSEDVTCTIFFDVTPQLTMRG